jgi:endoglucanase
VNLRPLLLAPLLAACADPSGPRGEGSATEANSSGFSAEPFHLGPRFARPEHRLAPDGVATLIPDTADSGDTGEPDDTTPDGGPFADTTLYVEPGGHAARQADAWRSSDPDAAAAMDAMAAQPVGIWLGDWTSDVAGTVDGYVSHAGAQLQVFVAYDIPHRDCGAWSSGGAGDAASYAAFIDGMAQGLDGRPAIVILEPDALPLTTCLDAGQLADRVGMLSDAVDVLTDAGASVYLDAGDSNWIGAAEIAARLQDAGVDRAAGFSLDVSHTEYTDDEIAYAEDIRARVGGDAHYVIDTSRNGDGPAPDNAWCNPLDRALGAVPTLRTGIAGLDAELWVKPPGESDGSCNGGPSAGAWWPEYALGLAEKAGY